MYIWTFIRTYILDLDFPTPALIFAIRVTGLPLYEGGVEHTIRLSRRTLLKEVLFHAGV